ncbi:nitrite reductase large subunit NirB [Rhodococcus sp. IEGM 1408]|uniref:nitrite reductase large subunit NirB n=1 Tax=Rhodococcus sp. IEGM 1408 TaxID=3082220 RepID=UPI002953A2F1|nr:nitrite reductase large subunit NirB [Rhodococcus sp. IEGM 1408]MDV8001029.1 nitrite reductase large subunit NirB [Rhodococcus sp. IEGM 1408]
MTEHIVVVGHGMVSHRFVSTLGSRHAAADIAVTVIGDEPDPAYDRVGLSSYIGAWERESLHLEDARHTGDPRVTVRSGRLVTAVDSAAQCVELDSGERISYDTLVLATGSRAFVPPVPGHDLPGCHVYRTLDDLDAVRDAAERAGSGAHGVVIGGGLLGLEAANALGMLGLTPHVVERNDRLMPVQVDTGGGALLGNLIGRRGIDVHLSVTGTVIEECDAGVRVTLTSDDDETVVVDAALVVFSVGIRPRDELARAAGLALAERGGVLTDKACRTSDPHVYAIGECAAIEGTCYGLVGPGYTSAEVAASQIAAAADSATAPTEFTGADLATKLKLMGVDVASFGDAHGRADGCLEVVVNDPVAGTYSKLVLSDDAQTLLGGVFVGDAGPYQLLKPLLGRTLPSVNPISLISAATSSETGMGVDALPDDAQICSCNAVTKGALREAICGGACDVPALKSCTRAGTSCGSCLPLMRQVLEAEGVEQSTALCEHFDQSRSELFEIVTVTGVRTFSGLIGRFGRGAGCDICKPTVASILASTSSDHVLDGEQASLQDTNDHFLANIQKNGTYSVVPRMPGGEVTAEQLIVIGEIARDHDLYVKVTGGQRIDLFGARVDELPKIWKRLVDAGMESGHAYGKSLRTVKSCVGTAWCRYGQQDSVGMAVLLENRFRGLRAPHKIKMGVSGCARECAEARGKDIGVIATETGWNLYVGGNGGATPRHANLLIGDLTDDQLIRYIDRTVMFYVRTAERLQRIAPWLESLEGGIEHLREVVCEDSLGLAAELEGRMEAHVAGYVDEWAAVLDDPDKLARFVSFVNAPESPDPTVQFEEKEGRKVPVLLGSPAMPVRA